MSDSRETELRRSVRLRRWWRRYWWLALALALAASLVVAFTGTEGSFGARLERSLLLLPIANRRDVDGLPLAVKAAYFAAAAVILYATYRAVFALFGVRLHEARAGLMRNHTVVYGLGSQGEALVESLLGTGKVVAVEQNPTNAAIQRLRDERAVVLVGDGADPEIVRRTNAERARHVVALCGQDAMNARVGANHALARKPGKRPLDLFVHISDPRLYTFLLHHSFVSRDGPRLELFNVYERGARGLLDEVAGSDSRLPERVLVVGAGQLGLALVSQLARRCFESDAPRKLRVDLVDREADARVALLSDRFRRLREVCELVPHTVDVASPAFDRLLAYGSPSGAADVCFVCFDDDTLTIATALNLLDQSGARFPVVARVSEKSEGIAGMIERAHSRYADAATFRPVVLAERAVQADLVLEGMRGQIARQIHETYREDHPGGPFDVPWSSLSDDGRERNLRHAETIAEQLEALGYRLGPLVDWGDPLPELTTADVEEMSRIEHERWLAERRAEGWRLGPARDDDARVHPDLVPWEELADERREINRRLVRGRPAMLARVGIQIYRDDLREPLARALHDAYVADRIAAGEQPGSAPSLAPWDELPEAFRESSRLTAEDLLAAVGELGYEVSEANGREATTLAERDVEALAERLHERWVEARASAGWQPGASRNDDVLAHPDLVPWSELPDARRDIDRSLVRGFPSALATVGLTLAARSGDPIDGSGR